jgi:hypothetical protein
MRLAIALVAALLCISLPSIADGPQSRSKEASSWQARHQAVADRQGKARPPAAKPKGPARAKPTTKAPAPAKPKAKGPAPAKPQRRAVPADDADRPMKNTEVDGGQLQKANDPAFNAVLKPKKR